MATPVEANLQSGAADQRRSPRQRVLLSGRLVFGESDHTVDCLIRDLSRVGAKVRLAGVLAMPPEVWLIELKSGVAFEARVAWRRLPDIGLQFISTHNLSDPLDARARSLRRIWVEAVAR